MHINTYKWNQHIGWDINLSKDSNADLVMVFSDNPFFKEQGFYDKLRQYFPSAQIIGCSSSGNILDNSISDDDIIIAAISLSSSKVNVVSKEINKDEDISEAVSQLSSNLLNPELKHIFVLSDGLFISGSELTNRLNNLSVPVTGGLAGDATRFGESWVMANGAAKQHQIALLGFYGDISMACGFATGWKEFGPERRVTKAEGNTIYEIDHKPALDIYVNYLGELSKDLPSSGLRFPMSIRASESNAPVIRTLMGINKEQKSLIFAGNIPEGYFCKLMKTDIDSLLDASMNLAKSFETQQSTDDALCLIVSCIGRRLVLDQIAEEEIEAIKSIISPKNKIFGFYSYGEVAPFEDNLCLLHNQTTTITLLSE